MKVCILTEGGKDIGFGHITRCTAIYQALQERKFQPAFIINGDESVKNENCRIFDWLSDRKTLFSLLKDADVVFIDSYLADYDLYERVSEIAGVGTYFDDNIRINYPKGFVINGAISAGNMPYPSQEGITYLLGAKYAPLKKEFWDVPAKQISSVPETVVITLGGSDVRNLTPKILKLLVDNYPQFDKKVIIGNGFRNISEIETVKGHNIELIYCPDAVKMREVMLESDIAVSAGGQTIYELARIGVPTIVIAVADNQMCNVNGGKTESGFFEYAGWWEHSELLDKVIECVEKLEGKDVRMEMSVKSRALIDGKGALRICDILIGSVRNAARQT